MRIWRLSYAFILLQCSGLAGCEDGRWEDGHDEGLLFGEGHRVGGCVDGERVEVLPRIPPLLLLSLKVKVQIQIHRGTAQRQRHGR